MSNHLNPSQLEAVATTGGPLLVIAGAGSGKTRVIEYRALNLVRQGVAPESILLLTFTRKAARQMLARAARHDPRCGSVNGGTFHSFACGVLRSHAGVLGVGPGFTIHAQEVVGRCAARLGFYGGTERFPKQETLLDMLSKAVNRRMAVEQVLGAEYPHFRELGPAVTTIQRAYTEFKVRSNCLDYDDLLVYLMVLLEEEPVREKLSQRYHYVMVDEYQDTNALQADIVHRLASRHHNVMVVGDDAQSIYRFRGAYRENILNFPARFPGCRVVTLEQNYRSTQAVLDLANAALANMRRKYPKSLTSAKGVTGAKPQLQTFDTDLDEAAWVGEAVKRLRDENVPLENQAVLYRSGPQSIALQLALQARNIPFEVYGGLRFGETAHVKDVAAHLKVLLNPKDQLAWGRLLQLLPGVGQVTAGRLIELMASAQTLPQCLDLLEDRAGCGKHGEGFGSLATTLRSALGTRGVGEQYDAVLDYYRPLLAEKYDDWHRRLEDLESLRSVAARYPSIEVLLSDLSLDPPERSALRSEAVATDDEKPLTLSTIHSAKGLEWEAVFLLGVQEGALPSSRAADEEDFEEEHRLFYVAVTRAKRHLFLTMHQQPSRARPGTLGRLSRFLEPPNVLATLERTIRAVRAPRQPTPAQTVTCRLPALTGSCGG